MTNSAAVLGRELLKSQFAIETLPDIEFLWDGRGQTLNYLILPGDMISDSYCILGIRLLLNTLTFDPAIAISPCFSTHGRDLSGNTCLLQSNALGSTHITELSETKRPEGAGARTI